MLRTNHVNRHLRVSRYTIKYHLLLSDEASIVLHGIYNVHVKKKIIIVSKWCLCSCSHLDYQWQNFFKFCSFFVFILCWLVLLKHFLPLESLTWLFLLLVFICRRASSINNLTFLTSSSKLQGQVLLIIVVASLG